MPETTTHPVDPDRFATLTRTMERKIIEWDISPRERAVAHVILDWSYRIGRAWARIGQQKDLADLTGIDEGDMSRTLKIMERVGILERKRGDGCRYYTLLPNADLRAPELRINAMAAGAARRRLAILAGIPEDTLPTGQKLLPLPPSAQEEFQDALAETTREEADHHRLETIASPAARSGAGESNEEHITHEQAAEQLRHLTAKIRGSLRLDEPPELVEHQLPAGEIGNSPTAELVNCQLANRDSEGSPGDSPPRVHASAGGRPGARDVVNVSTTTLNDVGRRPLVGNAHDAGPGLVEEIYHDLGKEAARRGREGIEDLNKNAAKWRERIRLAPVAIRDAIAAHKLRRAGPADNPMAYIFNRAREFAQEAGKHLRCIIW